MIKFMNFDFLNPIAKIATLVMLDMVNISHQTVFDEDTKFKANRVCVRIQENQHVLT